MSWFHKKLPTGNGVVVKSPGPYCSECGESIGKDQGHICLDPNLILDYDRRLQTIERRGGLGLPTMKDPK